MEYKVVRFDTYGSQTFADFGNNLNALESLIEDEYDKSFKIKFDPKKYGVYTFTNTKDRADFRVLIIWVFGEC